jgi:hypothetical protein
MTAADHGWAVIDREETMNRYAALPVAAAAAATLAGLAFAGNAAGPTSVSLSISPGGASCTYGETATPKVKCVNLKAERIESGTPITLVARANAALPAGWRLYIQKEGPFARNSDTKAARRRDSYPAPHLCGTTASSCTARTTRKVSGASFDLFRAVVQKNDGSSFEADIAIRWCDKSTPRCV